MLIGLDTNVVIRWLVDDGTDQPQSETAARIMREEALHLSAIALAEVIWVLSQVYRVPRNQLLRIAGELLVMSNLRLESAEQLKLAIAQCQEHQGDLNDHLLAAHDEIAGCSYTLTFDRKAARSPWFKRLHRRA